MNIVKVETDGAFEKVAKRIVSPGLTTEGERVLAEKMSAAHEIVDAVRNRGDAAVAEFTDRFDGVKLAPEAFELTEDDIERAVRTVDPGLFATLERAHDSIRRFHSKNLRESWEEELEDGTILGQRILPLASAGVYVPGGKAFYPSSVLMNIVPARVAGVNEIVMVSPPSYEGSIHPVVLAAAKIAGATRVFRIGGAQAVAALAYGTDYIPRVPKVTGPGNTYVTAAKRLVNGICAIDSEAGPSEVTVIADEKANPNYVAGEMLAQAEHDEEASSILITTSEKLANETLNVIEAEIQRLSRAEIIRASLGAKGGIFVVRDLDEAARLANIIAPEHLAIYTEVPRHVLNKIENAGSIMLGEQTTVVYGDYMAGPNHILPTEHRARFSSPLSAEDFRKVSSIISFSRERGRKIREDVMRLATVEELTAHARAAEIRS